MLISGLEWLKQQGKQRQTSAGRISQLDQIKQLIHTFSTNTHSVPVIHLAGSKGKGSTAFFTAGTLSGLGFRVLLFTSPHVYNVRERILLNQCPLDAGIWEKYLIKIHNVISSKNIVLGYFDILTVLAFWLAKDFYCDYLILETGIGGRWDTTNICQPMSIIFTPIEKEHMQILGNTLEKIAQEKAAIIKPQVPVFVGYQQTIVEDIIRKTATNQQAKVFFLKDIACITDTRIEKNCFYFDLKIGQVTYPHLHIKMPGLVQAQNATLALTCLLHTLKNIDSTQIINTWSSCIASQALPARFEIFSQHPLIVFDGCHTVESLSATITLWKLISKIPAIIVFSCKEDKNWKEMSNLLPVFDQIILTGSDPHIGEIFQILQKSHAHKTIWIPSEYDVCILLKEKKFDKNVLFTGSFYLIEIVKTYLTTLHHPS
ncbi:MAG: bifunctional folylpolyglutamate synthase/dihydrofolate synthase [Spirochaetia bacterium]